jgi:hypothetical protein
MEQMDRRGFVKLAGAGTAAAAAAAGVPLAAHLISTNGDVLRFRASGGMPQGRFPSYATHVVEGTIDLVAGSGVVTSRVLAGHPGDAGLIGLPGLGRTIRVTSVNVERKRYRLRGVVEDRSQLRRGESANVEIVVDSGRKLVYTPFVGRRVALPIE